MSHRWPFVDTITSDLDGPIAATAGNELARLSVGEAGFWRIRAHVVADIAAVHFQNARLMRKSGGQLATLATQIGTVPVPALEVVAWCGANGDEFFIVVGDTAEAGGIKYQVSIFTADLLSREKGCPEGE